MLSTWLLFHGYCFFSRTYVDVDIEFIRCMYRGAQDKEENNESCLLLIVILVDSDFCPLPLCFNASI